MITAKANEKSEMSDAIVVSFSSFWKVHIEEKRFSAIIRKRVPLKIQPKWIYFHVNAPVGEICGRALIKSVTQLSKGAAIKNGDRLMLSKKEILNYIGNDDTIGFYDISKIEIAKNAFNTASVKERMSYHPPQSFFYISQDGLKIINDFCEF
jgi:predicted transcriptional regulator